MKKTIVLALSLCLMGMSTAWAQFGKWQASETTKVKDDVTGVTLNVLTKTSGNDKFLYQTDPMWTPDGKYLLFRSSSRATDGEERTMPDGTKRTFSPTHVYFVEIATGRIIQATDNEYNGTGFLANKSNKMFLQKRDGNDWAMFVMDLDKFFADANKGKAKKAADYITKIGVFPADDKEIGRPGSFCINSDDTYAFITTSREVSEAERKAAEEKAFKPQDNQPVKVGIGFSGLAKMNLKTGEVSKIASIDFRVGHIQASRFRPNEIVFCCETGGDAYQRMWFCDAETCEFKPLYVETPLDWVTHETFASEDYVYFNVLGWQDRLRKQASGIFRINLRTDDVEVMGQVEMDMDRSSALTGRGFWHSNATRDNRFTCGDTFAGSIWVINNATGYRQQIASKLPMKPDHGHPFFSPDGTKLCFQSGRYSDGARLNLVVVDLTKLPVYSSK